MKHKLLNITKETNNKYLNLYLAKYEVDNGIKNYQICSRKPLEKLVLSTNKVEPDGVRILPYTIINNEIFIVVIKEFRYSINNYIYSLPAGLIDKNETPLDAAKRELEEEIGATIINIEKSENTTFPSVGMSDENLENYVSEVIIDKSQKLDFAEDIEIILLNLNDAITFVDNHLMGTYATLAIKLFYYKTKFNELKNKIN